MHLFIEKHYLSVELLFISIVYKQTHVLCMYQVRQVFDIIWDHTFSEPKIEVDQMLCHVACAKFSHSHFSRRKGKSTRGFVFLESGPNVLKVVVRS